MKRALLILTLLFIATSATFAQQSYVAVDEDTGILSPAVNVAPVQTQTTTSTVIRRTVQEIARPRQLTTREWEAVERYMGEYGPRMSPYNRTSLHAAVVLDIGMGFVHVPLDQAPNSYWKSYQDYTEGQKNTEKYVMDEKFVLPDFTPGSIPDLGLQGCKPIEKCKAEDVTPCVTPQLQETGAVAVSSEGKSSESVVAVISKSWKNIPRPKCIVKPPVPPVVGPCPDPVTLPVKPPTSASGDNPTYKEPVGAPAAGGPPTPTGAQTPVKIGNPSVTWGPTPTHPKVAASVN